MFQAKVVGKIKTHILCSITFFYPRIVTFVSWCGKTWYSRTGHNITHALMLMLGN